MSCCGNTTNGLTTENTDYLNFIGATGQTLTVTTLNATNIIGGPISNSTLLLKNTNTSRNGSSLIVTNDTGIAGPIAEGVHTVYDNSGKVGSFYAVDNNNLCTDLYLNDCAVLNPAPVHARSLKSNNISEDVANNGVQLQSGIKFLNDAKTIRNDVDSIIINANDVTNNLIKLQNQGNDKFTISSTENTSSQNLNMNSNTITFNSGQTQLKNNSFSLTNGANDAVHISTAGSAGNQWIGLSVGIDTAGLHNRVVIGDLNNEATIGGHLFSGNSILGWADLCLACEGGNVKINNSTYTSANNLSCAGYIDVQTGYKINNSAIIGYSGGSTANTFLLPNKSSGSYTIATTTDIPTVTYKQTIFIASGGLLVNNWFFGFDTMYSTEANVTFIASRSGNFSNMWVSLTGSPGVGVTYTFTVRVNNANSALAVAISGNTTTGSNTGTSVAISQGQVWSVQFTNSSGSGPISVAALSFDFNS